MPHISTLDPVQLVEEAPDLGSPPAVYRRLMEVLEDPNSGPHEVAAILSQDTSLTARLLRVANSAYFGFSRPVDSVHKAVMLIGAVHVRDLALATSVTSLFRNLPPDLVHLEDFWRHSLAVGIGARLIAGKRRESNVERFFVAGMLHDVGRLVVYICAPEAAREVIEHAEANECNLYASEAELMGFDHGTVGGVLMVKWKMPDSLVECVSFHHRPAEADRFPVETATIHLSDLIANALKLGRSGESRVPERWIGVWETLDMDPAELPELMSEIRDEYDQVVGAFGLESG